jgi:crotonobetainyl-CoA:carnitine CoA-transferase CaiB-like acyl-CoA transferase
MPQSAGNHEPQPAGGSALAGLSVLEIGENVTAPYCAKLLADLGADVIKIEKPALGDPSRLRGPFPDDVPHPERSALFLYLNTSKRSLTLDFETAEGQQIVRELAAQVDVLVEDRPPGHLSELGLGYAELAERNPRLIVVSITPFGQTGPNRLHRTHHLNLYHASGHVSPFASRQADADRPAPCAGGWLGEYDAGLTAALGTLAAVFGRGVTGRGQHIDLSKQEAMMCLERVTIGRFANEPDPFAGAGPGGLTRAPMGRAGARDGEPGVGRVRLVPGLGAADGEFRARQATRRPVGGGPDARRDLPPRPGRGDAGQSGPRRGRGEGMATDAGARLLP